MNPRTLSDSLHSEAEKVLVGGVNSPVRSFRRVGGSPILAKNANGPYLWDQDGKKYIDLVRDNIKPDLNILGAVLTMYDSRNRLSDEVFQELYKYFPNSIFRSVIPRTVRLAEAPSYGKSIFHYEPGGKGAKAYERLAREFLEQFEEQE
jgi:hypothetical protein